MLEFFKAMSETELEIIEMLWDKNEELTSAQILSICQENHDWKRQTLNTFLSRLTKKGVLQVTKQGRDVLYSPKLTREEYESNRAKSIIDGLYQGSVKNFMSALSEKHKLTNMELEELKNWIKEQE